ncbi:MAG: hypothetical protein PHH00_04450, partial [Candidatus Nanoarchaeia archaeon]|nr:hypothetical protein [Candidatus Nanoarchaeia archaeon]
SLILALIISYFFKGAVQKISKDYIEFLLGLSITLAGFGLVAFQIGKYSDELKKDFIESSILMLLSSLFSMAYWIDGNSVALAIIASFLFLWSIVLLLIILINERFRIIKSGK